jgi:hypothetical protein
MHHAPSGDLQSRRAAATHPCVGTAKLAPATLAARQSMLRSFVPSRLVAWSLFLSAAQLGTSDVHAAGPSAGAPSSALPTGTAPAPAPNAPPPPQHVYGLARRIHPPTPCDVSPFSEGGPGAPYVVAEGVPHVGQPFHVEWTTKPTVPGEPPAWPAMLLISFELTSPTSLAPMGAPGCYLMLEPEYIMTPQAGTILTQSGGRLRLDWTPKPGVLGQYFYSQMLCYAPGVNAGGFLVSPVLHTIVGN